jgi:RimJ/RimL family protein N-acetyltransferase
VSITFPLAVDAIHLRPITVDDCTPTYVAWLNDPEVTKFLETRWHPQTIKTVRAFVEGILAQQSSHLLAIIESETGRHVGNIKIGPVNPHHLSADISFFIGDKTCWGKGYATAAIRGATAWAFSTLGLQTLRAGAYGENIGSCKALEKSGYTLRAVFPDELTTDGGRDEHLYFSMTRSDFAKELL